MKCHLCNAKAVIKNGIELYNRDDLKNQKFYFCSNNHEPLWVGISYHPKAVQGTLADALTRKWRMIAHSKFDPIWKNKLLTRTQSYAMLGELMNLSSTDCHISLFTVEQCKNVVKLATDIRTCCEEYQKEHNDYN